VQQHNYTHTRHLRYAVIELLKVQSLISLTVTGGLLWGFVKGFISPEQFFTVAGMVMGFFFGTRKQKADYKGDKAEEEQSNGTS
jgi:hypothetical protein